MDITWKITHKRKTIVRSSLTVEKKKQVCPSYILHLDVSSINGKISQEVSEIHFWFHLNCEFSYL